MTRLRLVAAIAAFASLGASAQTTLSFATRTDVRVFEPLITAIYAELGYKVAFVPLPAERGLLSANDGSVDGDIGRNVTAGTDILGPYPNLLMVEEALFESYDIAYALRGSDVAVKGPVDLQRYRVGIVRGSKTAENLVERYGLSAIAVEDRATLDKMLRAKRVDVAIGASPVAVPEDLVVVNPRLERIAAYHILNRKWARLVPELERVIREMKADGRMAALLKAR